MIERNPTKSRILQAASHRYAIRKLRSNPKLIKYPVRIVVSLLLLDLLLCRDYRLYVFRSVVAIWICPERLPGLQNLRVFRTSLEWRIHLADRIAWQGIKIVVLLSRCDQLRRV